MENDVSASSGISSPLQAVNSMSKRSLYAKITFISIFSLFLVFKHDWIRCIDFTRIAGSNTASDDVTN